MSDNKLKYILKKYWGYDSFRFLQEEAIESVISGNDTVVLFPTGGGKSLIYQISGLVLNGLTLVVTPLISLIQDQVEELRSRSIIADSITSAKSEDDVVRIFENVLYGNTKFIFVAPERFRSKIFQKKLKEVNVSLFAIDEAHCVSTWGHDFRPAYLELKLLRKEYPRTPIVCLTATATHTVVDDIRNILKLNKPQVFKESFQRKNIQISHLVAEDKMIQIRSRLAKTKGATIIYCNTRKETEKISYLLKKHGVENNFYHAGLDNYKRAKIQENWFRNNPSVIVATSAFGMGINKPDVSLVVHQSIPSTIESYYQEIGRAGRDGQPAEALLIYNNHDIEVAKKNVAYNFPTKESISVVYQSIFKYFKVPYNQGQERSFVFNFLELSTFCKVTASQLLAIIKVLEREGWMKFTQNKTKQLAIKFNLDKRGLADLTKYPELEKVTTYLLRNYDGLFFTYARIDADAISKYLKISIEELNHYLVQLSQMKIIFYSPQKVGSGIFFYKNRLQSHVFSISKDSYDKRKNHEEAKLSSVLELVTTTTKCKQSFILNYFGEENEFNCGICDSCLINNPSSQIEILEKKLQNLISSDVYSLMSLIDHFKNEEKPQVRKILHHWEDIDLVSIDEDFNVHKSEKWIS